ncbi:MAG: hypothetical protein QOG38_1560 [Hyphomicrobiales bacterium]|jgi:hypothetical protein|nr:hypothetical protein [Hyphomicrobiales bacterium]
MPATTRQPHFALLLGLAWLLVVVQLLVQNWGETAQTLLDTDDAMRLAQLRDWLGGQGWYDLVQHRVEPPAGYESHWSRLIDLGLAGTLRFFGMFIDGASAERLMRAVWPMLWLLPTIGGTAAIAWRISGREAALLALLLAVVGLPAFHQFRPGRIDHHNVQIALSVLVVAATVWSDRMRWAAWAAGAVTGLALAIGLECLPYLMVCGAAFAVRYVVDRSGGEAAARYGLALAASSVAGFLVIVAPAQWTRGVCDAIAINWVALVVVGGLGLAAAAQWFASDRLTTRLASTGAVGAAATGLFLAIQPACLHGPYAMMDPAVWPIWLAHVREMQPLIPLLAKSPLTAIAIAAFPAAAAVAALVLLGQAEHRRDFGFLAAAAAFVSAAITTIAAIKAYSYATWLGMPLVAVLTLHLFTWLRLQSLVPRFALGMLLTPAGLSIGAIAVANAAGIDERENFNRPEREACLKTGNYAPLARLPAGLIASDIDFGPFLLALTPHAVLAAPYHRLSTGIVAAHEAFTAPPDVARRILARSRVDYVVTCGPRPPSGLAGKALSASLWGKLQAGEVPDWLEPIRQTGPFVAYRIKPQS